jgi:hypothetical protein
MVSLNPNQNLTTNRVYIEHGVVNMWQIYKSFRVNKLEAPFCPSDEDRVQVAILHRFPGILPSSGKMDEKLKSSLPPDTLRSKKTKAPDLYASKIWRRSKEGMEEKFLLFGLSI